MKELKHDIGLFFKAWYLQKKIEEIRHHKTCAIQQQDYEKAVRYREEEKEQLMLLWVINEEINKIADKYVPETMKSYK